MKGLSGFAPLTLCTARHSGRLDGQIEAKRRRKTDWLNQGCVHCYPLDCVTGGYFTGYYSVTVCYTVVQCCSGEKIHIGGCLFASPAVYYHRLCYGYCITGDLPASMCYSVVQCVAVSQATAGFTVSFFLVSTTQVPALAQVNYTQVTYPGPGTGNFSWSRSTVLAQVNSTQVTYPGPGKLSWPR